MTASGTADADHEVSTPFGLVCGEEVVQERLQAIDERSGLLGGKNKTRYGLVETREGGEFWFVVRVRQKPDVKEQLGVAEHSVLEAK